MKARITSLHKKKAMNHHPTRSPIQSPSPPLRSLRSKIGAPAAPRGAERVGEIETAEDDGVGVRSKDDGRGDAMEEGGGGEQPQASPNTASLAEWIEMTPPLISVTQLDREKRRGRFKGYERVKICVDHHHPRRQREKCGFS
ncbi:hypothetical protein BHE74_00039072 [Ensete ventricosum]|nr:hypothetical protein BHE74_00039072 [Ensete ventricosum]